MEMGDEEVAGIEETTLSKNIPINLADMDLPSWKHDLKADLFIIDALLQEMYKITPEDDFKLQHIKTHIDEKLANPINEGNNKVLIFTAYADTASYLYEHLSKHCTDVHGLHSGKVTGSDTPACTLGKGFDFQTVLTLFSPVSKEKALIPSSPLPPKIPRKNPYFPHKPDQ
jgi:hypothetical protein